MVGDSFVYALLGSPDLLSGSPQALIEGAMANLVAAATQVLFSFSYFSFTTIIIIIIIKLINPLARAEESEQSQCQPG